MMNRELVVRTASLVLVLGVALGGWLLLSMLVQRAAESSSPDTPKKHAEKITEHAYEKALDWGTKLLGLAGTLAGFLGVAAASQRSEPLTAEERARSAEGGMIGVLVGATLLEVGGWAVPLSLAVLVTGSAAVRVLRTLREPTPP